MRAHRTARKFVCRCWLDAGNISPNQLEYCLSKVKPGRSTAVCPMKNSAVNPGRRHFDELACEVMRRCRLTKLICDDGDIAIFL